MHRHTPWILVGLLLCSASTAWAGDWPQILGPTRNGQAVDEQIAEQLPATGPRVLWQTPVGRGYAGPAVAQGKLVLFHRQGNDEIVAAFDAATGKPLWTSRFPTRYVSSIDPDNGPRCVPLIANSRVYLHGVDGNLFCLTLADGRKIWSRDLKQDFDAGDGYFGAGSTPLLEGDKLLVNVGGREAGIVAFDAATGKTLWQATDDDASYSSPVAATVNGRRHAIFVTRQNALSLDPADGTVRFQFPFGRRGPTVNAANPLVLGDKLFLSASYGVGATFAQIEDGRAKILWQQDDLMSSQYTTCVEHQGLLYGIDGRQDVGVARLRCFDPNTAEIRWTKESFGMASLIQASGKLLLLTSDGQLVIARATGERYDELARVKLFDTTTRALPALADGKFYARDEATLKCFDLRPAQ